ncbi:MAG: nucleoside/nucleotide kinase family protein [Erysipelotrichaceae bacterium]|nr:nucleoside/nucleotide kinase family protein [Erysipelotrichaceae bacterium]MBO4537995.1 nucleoside/nucleotide kinase family protein [Erysipelotrichaceae bacterium]MBR5048236.1 nucleoside/nucleotide kinase family protein [Erysipelotrichaceae bacterium]
MLQQYTFEINGLEVRAQYDSEDVENVFKPLLRRFQQIQQEAGRRIFVFLAAPPGSGKSTLLAFLQDLANKMGISNLQTVGMDGFHYPKSYLQTHYTCRNGQRIRLTEIKGQKQTFDVSALYDKLRESQQGDSLWPVYSRQIHDPISDALLINKDIVILEGNYLLLGGRWKKLREFCDLSILISCDHEVVRERLIDRKFRGGVTMQQAIEWYEKSDSINVGVVLNESKDPDILINYDGTRYQVAYGL